MTTPSLLRSLTFWSGVFVICFGFWAWWDSYRFNTDIDLGAIRLSNVSGHVTILGRPDRPAFGLARQMGSALPRQDALLLPYWFLLTSGAIPWLLSIAWIGRRICQRGG